MATISDDGLPAVARALAVIAHPDDESFGLGSVLSAMVDAGTRVVGVCFTHGEASTLGAADADLHHTRAVELADAARSLGIGTVELLDYPDGRLADIAVDELADRVVDTACRHRADLLVVFDEGGITGHPDHQHATAAALAAARRLDLPVLAWAVPDAVASALNTEFATGFVGRTPEEIEVTLRVDRARQLAAIACHRSQSATNPVLWRRLELSGEREPLRWLRPPGPRQASVGHGAPAAAPEMPNS